MNQSTFPNSGHPTLPALHVAIIMDGSGRWAQARGLPRTEGHRAGVEAVRRVVGVAPRLGIGTLTLHAFSSDNWQRPEGEVRSLLRIFEDYLRSEPRQWTTEGVQLTVLGRRDRLPPSLLRAIKSAEAATAAGGRLHLRLAIDYSGREAILRAAGGHDGIHTHEEFSRLLGATTGADSLDVDLLIRTGGEQRLSNFMLWECAYAELYFTPRLWPDFNARDLDAAIRDFHSRDRRFGRIPEHLAV